MARWTKLIFISVVTVLVGVKAVVISQHLGAAYPVRIAIGSILLAACSITGTTLIRRVWREGH